MKFAKKLKDNYPNLFDFCHTYILNIKFFIPQCAKCTICYTKQAHNENSNPRNEMFSSL